ncbi:MAG: TIGR03032 family protein [Pirellulales bacterium]|nr:TIGR03032 family protein [Pirellulales bacterium]
MNADPTTPDAHANKSQLRCRSRGGFADWLAASGGSLAVTTYTSGKLVLLSTKEGRLRFRTRKFPRPMGLALRGNRLALAVQQQILLFRETGVGKFALEQEFSTGKVDAHDVAFGRRGVYFANTRWNCIARAVPEKRFLRSWLPPFVPKTATRDHCHLNGLGMQAGRPAMSTAFCVTDQPAGWRGADRFTTGVLIDIAEDRVVATGLSMPHSPRWHQGRWWLCNSGEGALSTFDEQSGRCEPFCRLPGLTRGLCFVGDYALVGLSKIRKKHILETPLVRASRSNVMSGVALVDLQTARQVGALEFVRGGREVYEVVFLPGRRRPDVEEQG